MSTVVGIGGLRRHAGAALAVDGCLVAACEEERISRTRGIGVIGGGFPYKALEMALTIGHATKTDIASYVTGEAGLNFPSDTTAVVMDHHLARPHAPVVPH